MDDFFSRFDWNKETRKYWSATGSLHYEAEINEKASEILASAGRIQDAFDDDVRDTDFIDQQLEVIKDELKTENTLVNDFVIMLDTFNEYLINTRRNMVTFMNRIDNYEANPMEIAIPATDEMLHFKEVFGELVTRLDDIYGWALGQNDDLVLNQQFGEYVADHLYVLLYQIIQLVKLVTQNPPMDEPIHPLAAGFHFYHSVMPKYTVPFATGTMQEEALTFLVHSIVHMYERMVLSPDVLDPDGVPGMGLLLDDPALPPVR